MPKYISCLLCTMFLAIAGNSQDLPTDYLPADFHKERREAVRAKLPPNTAVVLFANAERNRANDVDYVYHQDPNFYYLTGYKEPNAVLVLFSEAQTDADGNTFDELFYVQERNARAEQWTGKRLGVEGAKEKLGFDMVFNGSDFENFPLDFKAFDHVSFVDFHNDYRDKSGSADLFDLIKTFKVKANYPADYNPVRNELYKRIAAVTPENSKEVAETIERYMERYPELQEDDILNDFIGANNEGIRDEVKNKVMVIQRSTNLDSSILPKVMAELRQDKTPEEMKLLKRAIEISAVGQIEVMKAMHPNMSETEIQGVHEYVYKRYGAEYEGYPSIVGGGHNGCILHYIENNKTKVGDDLVLMDLGAEYHGYTADVTRTIPANGKFSPEQKAIYDIVYNAQEAGIAASVVGASFREPHKAALDVVTKGLLDLGIIKDAKDARIYFPHGTSHYLGLDVHDAGTYQAFRPNQVITVEPGIYIPENSDCDEKWWGIAVRIEDDILITENGPINLSGMAPRTTEAIEEVMKQPSPLDSFKLPKLD
ncbi:aminopeptidase P family protein [Flagellimonas okinawensis]|uniref:Xaa-Pro aminopeptidase n=1 Tax=Flagellimonas okinawensis TaxID=3031324 RepID=A0ABT5XRW2_9FLAO|nr:aminopeptidase P family protein [[Muricauda] okinawensis]MDF0708629.1 aminopeptidase P family protein [[Muricauda] okinawensis]